MKSERSAFGRVPTFDGVQSEWENWWLRFDSAIDTITHAQAMMADTIFIDGEGSESKISKMSPDQRNERVGQRKIITQIEYDAVNGRIWRELLNTITNKTLNMFKSKVKAKDGVNAVNWLNIKIHLL